MIFDYPEPRSQRRHGPAGYSSHASYRPWLRDEFDFRCVYCLKRETWGQATGEFDIDHFQPQALYPQQRLDYQNLVYACGRCNSIKRDNEVADPFVLLHSCSIITLPDGSLASQDAQVQQLFVRLDLNSPRLRSWRLLWLRIVALAQEHEPELFARLIGLPQDLPNLSRLRPPVNTRRQGVHQSWYAKRSRGEALAY